MRDEGGKKSENGESDYVQMIIYKEVKRSGVGDLIYRNERKERRGRNTYLDRLMTYLKTFCMFYLCLGGVQRIDHKPELSPRSHYIVKTNKKEVTRSLEEENIIMNYRWHSHNIVILMFLDSCLSKPKEVK